MDGRTGTVATYGFSQKTDPVNGYADYYEKVTTYAAILVSARPRRSTPRHPHSEQALHDRRGRRRLRLPRHLLQPSRHHRAQPAARAGEGRRSSGWAAPARYILDLLAKTPDLNIHLYDGDVFSTHNAFRAPGAATLRGPASRLKKVDYYASTYAAMRRRIHPHAVDVTSRNVAELLDADFVFLAMDSGPAKKSIIDALVAGGVPFIDTGVGVSDDPDGIGGQIRATTSLPGASEHITTGRLISTVAADATSTTPISRSPSSTCSPPSWPSSGSRSGCRFYADAEGELHSVVPDRHQRDPQQVPGQWRCRSPADDAA